MKTHFGRDNPNWKGIYPIIRKCVLCHKEFRLYSKSAAQHQKHCSKKCGDISGSLKRRNRIKIICKVCGKVFISTKQHGLKRKTCSYKCMGELYKRSLKSSSNPNWRGGISFKTYTLKWTKELRESVRKRDKYKCKICGLSEKSHITKLHIHHIDFNKKNPSRNNLISLCKKCHMGIHNAKRNSIKNKSI